MSEHRKTTGATKRILTFLEHVEREQVKEEQRAKEQKRVKELQQEGLKQVILFRTTDRVAKELAEFVCESGRNYQLDKQWSARFDRRHVPQMDDHLHVLYKGNERCVINRDGSPSHGTRIDLPRHVRQKIHGLGLVNIEESAGEISLLEYVSHNIGVAALKRLLKWADELLAEK